MKRIPIYNIILGDACGIKKMSLVEFPAVESDFLAFAQQQPMKFSYDEQQHIVFGCALRADFPIYRFSDRIGEYYVTFSRQTIKELYERFMIEGHNSDVNLQHTTDTDGVYLIQSFLKDTEKGISPIGFEEISDGSWFCAYKVENEAVWEQVKSGEFKGFSVEGFFDLELAEPEDDIDILIDEMLK